MLRKEAKTLLEPLAKTHDLRFVAFDRDVSTIGADPAKPEVPEADGPASSSTRIGDAIARVIDDAGDRPIAGILLLSDGRNTAGASPAEAARLASNDSAPVFPVTLGGSVRMKDVAIVDVFAPNIVSVGDTVKVAVTIESSGFDGRATKVDLKTDSVIDSKEIVLRGAEQQVVELTFAATKPGSFALTVEVPPQPEEAEVLRSNNSDVAFVKVTDEKIKVLLIDGSPRWDFRFLKNAMRRDHGLGGAKGSAEPDVRVLSEMAGGATVPSSPEDLAGYDVVVLGDAAPGELGPKFLESLGKAVREKGLGLIVEAGPRHMPHEFDAAFRDLLPVKVGTRSSGVEAPVYSPFRLEVSAEGGVHEAMRLFDDPGRSAEVWAGMPAFFWCASADRPAPGATVLAWNPAIRSRFGKLPLIAHHVAGKGRVVFVGTDSTWLWRQNVGDRFFYKFWGQAVRFAAKSPDDAKKTRIEARPVRAQPGEPVRIEVMAFAEDGSPRAESRLPASVLSAGGAPVAVELVADPAIRGRFTATVAPESPGDYRASFDPGSGSEPIEARFRVLESVEELRHPDPDAQALAALAGATGGKVLGPDEIASVRPLLKGEATVTEIHREATVWDNWIVLALLMGLYSIDVGLRRLAGLS